MLLIFSQNNMNLKIITDILREFGPTAVMFIVGIWGIYSTWQKWMARDQRADKKQEELFTYLMTALDKRDDDKKKQHDRAAKFRKELMYKCDTFAKEMLIESGANQVSIYDYCNGTQNLIGIPFLHFRTIAEKTAFVKYKGMYEKLDINALGVFLLDLEKEQTITIKNIKKEEDRYPELGYYLGLQKQHKGVFANIVGVNSSLGFISITYDHNAKVDYDKIEKIVYEYAQKISNLLDYYNLNS